MKHPNETTNELRDFYSAQLVVHAGCRSAIIRVFEVGYSGTNIGSDDLPINCSLVSGECGNIL